MLVNEKAQKENRTNGVCTEFFFFKKNGILQFSVNICEKTDYPESIRREAISSVASMVDLLDDRFLVHNIVHKLAIKLLRFCVSDERQSELYHEDLVDFMYIICSKIRGFPALLNIFFHYKRWLTTPNKSDIDCYRDEVNDITNTFDVNTKFNFASFMLLRNGTKKKLYLCVRPRIHCTREPYSLW